MPSLGHNEFIHTMAADGLITLLHNEPGHQEQYCLVLLKCYSFRTKRVNPLRCSDTPPIISASAPTDRFSLKTRVHMLYQFIFSCEIIYLITNWLDYIFFLQAATSLTVMSMFNQSGQQSRRPDSAAHYALMTSLAAIFQHTLPVSQSKIRKGHGHV